LNTTAINSQQDTQLIFNKAVNIDGFYMGINSIEDDYLSFRDTVKITNTKGFGINLLQSQLAEFKKGVSIEGEFNGSSGYGIYVGGYFSAPDPHQVIFYGDVDIKNQYTGIYLDNSNVEFQKVVNVESEVGQSSGYGIYIPAQVNDSSLNKVIFADDVTIKNQSISGLYLEKNNTVFNGNVIIEDSYHSLFSNATLDATTNPTPIFNKNVTINNGTNGILVTGGELIFNGPVVINKSSFKGMNIASGGNNGENSKLYFNDTVEVNDCVAGISTYNEFASNYLFFEKGLTINNPNIPANNEVKMDYDDYITFKGDSAVNAQIRGGIVTFTGAPTISRTIEDAQIVDFALIDSSKRISLNADIGGTEIYTNAVKMGIDSNITFTGNLHADNTIFDLSTKILTIDGTFTHGTNPVSPFVSFAMNPVGGITIDTYYDGTNAGHFEFATLSTVIDLSNSSKMIINITEAPGIPVLQPGQTRQFDLFVGNGVSNFQLIDANNITIATNNPLSEWTIDTQEGILYQSLKTGGVGNMFKMVDSDGVTDPLMDSDDFVQELLNIIMDKGPIAGADTLDKIGTPGAVVAASAPLSNIETGIIDTRLSNVIGAGDEEPIYGAWFAPLYGKARQKIREEQPGFKSTYFGGIIGFDSKIDDYLSVGVAAGMSNGKLSHTDSNKGDRTDHKAYVGIIYLSYDLTERWMLQNTFSYGFSKVHNKEIRISTPINKIARAKYDERRISNNIGLGYKTLLSNEILFIPFFALDFNRVGSIKYTETGADIQNLRFNRSGLTEVDGIIGARLSKNFQYEDFVITPAVVANMRYAISGQEFKTDVRLASDDTIQIVPKTVSPARKLYRLGASVNINNKDKDFLINYEFRKAEKFTSHQGSLKIQISF
jgi:outer membrane autotransporter protein